MEFLNRLNFFKKEPPEPQVEEVSPEVGEAIWSDSVLYNPADFPRFNQDDLIGRKGFGIYKKMMLDEQVKAAAKFRRNSVTGRGWTFEFDSSIADELSEEEMDLRIKVLTYNLRKLSGTFKKSLNMVMLATQQGFSITEKTWGSFRYKDQVYWGIANLRAKPFDTFEVRTDDFGNLTELIQEIGGKRQTVDPNKVIWHVVNPEVDEYYGQSELREAYRDWYSKDILTKLENIYLERMAGGLVWAEHKGEEGGSDRTMTNAEKSALQNVLSNIQTKTGIKMPRGWELKVNNPTSTDAFSNAIERHDRNLAKALLMPNLMGLTESGQTGSYSQSQTQLEGFLWMLDSDADDLAEVINEQLIQNIGEFNWGDGLYPEFKFNPLSKSQLYSVVDTWKDLVTAGAVTKTEADEQYIREVLGFPALEMTEAEEEEPEVEPDPEEPTEEPSLDAEEEVDEEDQPEEEEEDMKKDEAEDPSCDHDHTFFPESGATNVLYSSFTRAQRRVDFSAIDRSTTMNEWQAEQEMGDTMAEIANYFSEQLSTNPALMTDPEETEKLIVPPEHTAALKKTSKKALAESWDIGVENGKRELEKAGMQRMSKASFAKFQSVSDVAATYFDTKAFQMAGNLTNEALALTKNIILNGIKYGKSEKEVSDEIYRTFASKGMISEDQAVAALGEALEVENPTHRLNTVVRTNSFEAVNEARYSYFTDEELGGFVTALEYSAILDSRTTEVCSNLDGKVYPLRSDEWQKYRPPNHYNCRSLLVAVTQRDEDIEVTAEAPTVEPQEGFK